MLAREKRIDFFDVKTKAMFGICPSFFVPFAFLTFEVHKEKSTRTANPIKDESR